MWFRIARVSAITLIAGACASSTSTGIKPPSLLGTPVVADSVRTCTPRSSSEPAITIAGARLSAAYDLLLARSGTFATAADSVSNVSQFRIRIGYAAEFDPPYISATYAESRVAGVFVAGFGFTPAGTPVCDLNVVFFTSRTEAEAREQGYAEESIVLDLATILAHELYGHAFPMAFMPGVPRWPSPCGDPDFVDMDTSAGCAGDRENEIRRELGLPVRMDYTSPPVGLLCYLESKPCGSMGEEKRGTQ